MRGEETAYMNYQAFRHLLRRSPASLRVDMPTKGIPGAARRPCWRLGHICVILPWNLLQRHQVHKGRFGVGYRRVVHYCESLENEREKDAAEKLLWLMIYAHIGYNKTKQPHEIRIYRYRKSLKEMLGTTDNFSRSASCF